MEDHDCGSKDAQQAADFSVDIQSLAQEVWWKDSTEKRKKKYCTFKLYDLRQKICLIWNNSDQNIKNISCIYLTKTLNAPRGVTNVAGANAYAAKLAASPIPTKNEKCTL